MSSKATKAQRENIEQIEGSHPQKTIGLHAGAVSMRVSSVLRSAEAYCYAKCNWVTTLSGALLVLTKKITTCYRYRVDIKINMLSTPWCSRAVPQPSTDLALHRFAAEFGWDPAFSMQYGRQPMHTSKSLSSSIIIDYCNKTWLSGVSKIQSDTTWHYITSCLLNLY